MNEERTQGRLVEKPALRALPPRAERERMLGLVLQAASERARIWFVADDAADLAQDVGFAFWQAWEADPGLFDAETVPMHWIGVAVRNAAIRRHRAEETRAFAEVPSDDRRDRSVESSADIAAEVEAFDLERHLLDAFHALSARQRDIWVRVRNRDQGYDEIAAALNIGRESVKTHMSRANRMMRNALVRHDGGPLND